MNASRMLIRHLKSADLDALLELYTHLHAADTAVPRRSIVESVWQQLVNDPAYRYYGGYVGEALVCSCILAFIPNLTRGCQSYGVIENVVTHRQHRRQGFGEAILRRALDEAWSAGCYKVMLLTGRKDEATFRFYESVGFNRHEKQAFIAKPAA